MKDQTLGFNSAILDVIWYLVCLGIGWKLGHPLWGVYSVAGQVVLDLVISYNLGKKLEG
jgi:hypothetical protein